MLLAVLDYWSNFWMIRVTIGWSELLLNDQSNYWMIRVTIGWSEFLLDDQRNYWIIRVTIGWSELLLDDQSAASQLLCLLQLTLGGGTRDHGGGEEEADSQDLASHCHRLSSANSKTSLQKYQRFYQKKINIKTESFLKIKKKKLRKYCFLNNLVLNMII